VIATPLLICVYFGTIVLYIWFRPSWRNIGPSLLDSFVIGQTLYAMGSILLWLLSSQAHAVDIVSIGVTGAAVSNLSAAACSFALRERIRSLDFAGWSRELVATPSDRFAITFGLLFCILVTGWFLIQVLTHDHIRSLLNETLHGDPGSFTMARLIMSAGTEGYFAPGYVKQFRDVLVPILCSAAIFCHGTFRNRSLVFGALAFAILGVFVAGLRMTIVQFALTLAVSVFYDYRVKTSVRLMPVGAAAAIFLVLFVVLTALTNLLGRANLPSAIETPAILATKGPVPTETNTPSGQPAPQLSTQTMPEDQRPSSFNIPELGVFKTVKSVAERSLMSVPQENALTYKSWGSEAPTYGVSWLHDMAGVLPGTQFGLSNRLAAQTNVSGTILAASPLGFAADLYYNWGYAGLCIVSALCAFGFLLLDNALARSRSALLYATKTFIFFSIPAMYSPFFFVLYGGAVMLAMMCYVALAKRMLRFAT
jgi:hypothetical protein